MHYCTVALNYSIVITYGDLDGFVVEWRVRAVGYCIVRKDPSIGKYPDGRCFTGLDFYLQPIHLQHHVAKLRLDVSTWFHRSLPSPDVVSFLVGRLWVEVLAGLPQLLAYTNRDGPGVTN